MQSSPPHLPPCTARVSDAGAESPTRAHRFSVPSARGGSKVPVSCSGFRSRTARTAAPQDLHEVQHLKPLRTMEKYANSVALAKNVKKIETIKIIKKR